MIRKWLTTLLCLLLSLALPLCALAGTQHTVQVIPGDDMASVDGVKDLCDALAVKVTTNDKAGALTLNLSGTDVLNVKLTADENGLYVQSELLGGDVYFVNWQEGLTFLMQLMKDNLPAEEYAQVEAQMEQAVQSIAMAFSGEAASQEDAQANLDKALEQFQDDPKMVEWLKGLMDKVQEEEGEFTSDDHDAAAKKTTITMTAEDLLPLFETNYLRNTMLQSLLSDSENKELSQEQLNAEVDEELEEARKVLADSGYTFTMETYTDASGETLMGLNMSMSMEIKDDDETDGVTSTLVYNRLTTADGVSHKGDFVMDFTDGDEQQQAVMKLDLLNAQDKADGFFAMLVAGTEMTVQVKKEQQDGASVKTVALYVRDNAAAIVPPAASDRPVFTVKVTSQDVDQSALSGFDTQNAVDLLKMTADERTAWLQTLQSNAMTVLMYVMSALPQSTLQLFMSSGSEAIQTAE